MTFTRTGSPFSSSFGTAPRALTWLISATVGISVVAGLLDRFFTGYLGVISPHWLFGLSWGGVQSFFLWQPFTYMFLHHGMGGLSLGFIIEVFFHMYLLYAMGSAVFSHLQTRGFLTAYFGSGIAAGFASLLVTWLSGYQTLLVGAGTALFGIITIWAMLFPTMEIMLFFAIRCTARILLVAFLGITLLIDLSQGDLVGMATYLVGALTGYLYGVIAWDLRGPFPQTHAVDAAMANLTRGVHSRSQATQDMMANVYQKAKVFDFKTGEAILDDEEFMDIMLTKISKYGEKSLSRQERKRMRQISKKKAGG